MIEGVASRGWRYTSAPMTTAEPRPEHDAPNEPGELERAALAWLESLAAEPTRLTDLSEDTYRRLRDAAGRIAFPDRTDRRRMVRERRRNERERVRDDDAAALAKTSNRQLRRDLRFPQAPVDLPVSENARKLLEQRAAMEGAAQSAAHRERLRSPRSCYVCKADFQDLHHHYDHLCPPCSKFNWSKRMQTADLTGRVALVTGARVKIGFETALILLRAGATVLATTRFPCDAARRFAAESDYAQWSERLQVFGLELRHIPSVERFADDLLGWLPRLDVIIHNACQTVRRPPAYYEHLVEREQIDDLAAGRMLLRRHEALVDRLSEGASGDAALSVAGEGAGHAGIVDPSGLTQLDLLAEGDAAELFPAGVRDADDQQLDLRLVNSWRMNLADVPTVELLEVQLVNAVAPFVLTGRLKPLMVRVPTRDKHIVNVSAMEGQFYRSTKTTRHPHTNMAKAALNMMTRTSASEFVRDGIHMNSVDTGWITDEDPFEKSLDKEVHQRFHPPLDSIDGAARVLDPVLSGFLTGVHCWGQFLKDYRPTRW